jgi:cytochrome c553
MGDLMISKFFMFDNLVKPLSLFLMLIFTLIQGKFVNAEVIGDLEAGKNKISMCVGCHGIPEYKTAFPKTYRVPKIAGQRSEYIVSALKAYRSEQRSHPSMRAVASSMTDQDIADVATFYSTLKQ